MIKKNVQPNGYTMSSKTPNLHTLSQGPHTDVMSSQANNLTKLRDSNNIITISLRQFQIVQQN